MLEFWAGQKVEEDGFCADRQPPMHLCGYRRRNVCNCLLFMTLCWPLRVISGWQKSRRVLLRSSKSRAWECCTISLGVKVIQNPQTGEVWIGQEAYAQRVLQKFGMENAKPIHTPVDAGLKLVKTTEDCENVDQVQFQSAVG